jgi:arylsulfatase A-like enzyme
MMVRTDQHKLCVDAINRQPIEQYDLGADPNELHNLIDNPAYAKLRGELINDVLAPMLSTLDTSVW